MVKTDVIIIGAGPVGLFAVHQLGIKGLKAVVIDNLDKAGGQCIELYPDKPIYDIPAVPECTGKELTNKLIEQIKPFKTEFFLNERVEEVKQDRENWIVKTNNNNEFSAPNIIIAGGVGSFEPRKLAVKEAEKFEDKFLFYAVKDKEILNQYFTIAEKEEKVENNVFLSPINLLLARPRAVRLVTFRDDGVQSAIVFPFHGSAKQITREKLRRA